MNAIRIALALPAGLLVLLGALTAGAGASPGALAATAGTATFTDPAGDALGGPDVTQAVVSGDAATGLVTFGVTVPGHLPAAPDAYERNALVWIDADMNAATGDPDDGADFLLMAWNDEFQVHVMNSAVGGVLGLADQSLVLPPGKTYTAEWFLLPVARPDFWEFVNVARRARGANFTLPWTFAFLGHGSRTDGWSDDKFATFIRNKSANLVAASIDYPRYNGHYSHGTAFQHIDLSSYAAYSARVRRLCLALPATSERLSHGEPTFFVHKKVFVMFADNHHNDGRVAVWLPVPPGAQEDLLVAAPERFFKPPYVGVRGWIGIELDRIDDAELEMYINSAWELIASQQRRSRRNTGAGS